MKFKSAIRSKYALLVFIDLIMMILLILNLSLIVFDFLFSIPFVNEFFEMMVPRLFTGYNHYIHLNFYKIDLIFISIFFGEFLFSWVLAIINKIHHRWFFYPFIHWYDLLGCIPIDTLRFVRIFRVFSILVRLQNLELIDLTKTYVYVKLKKYYNIIVEEVSDRVVTNVLQGMQEEVRAGNHLIDKVIGEVVRPKQKQIVEIISKRMALAVKTDLLSRKKELSNYVKEVMSEALSNSAEIRTVEQVPVMGRLISETIEKAITDVINGAIEKMLADLASDSNRPLVMQSTELVLNSFDMEQSQGNELLQEIIDEVLEIVKKQVQIKKWKLKEMQEEQVNSSEAHSIEFLLADK